MVFGGDAVPAPEEAAVLAAARAVVTTSDWTRRELLDRYQLEPHRVHVAHPGTRRAPLSAGTADGGRLLAVGALAPHKGQDLLLTALAGTASLRLPRAADLLPPELGRRLLALAPDDLVTSLPARRIAGMAAGGLRLSPADPDTTVGRVDVWADPDTGLPLHVEVAPKADPGVPLLISTMQEVALRAPDPAVLVPPRPPGSSRVRAAAADLGGALRVLDAPAPPAQLAGRPRVAITGDELPGVGVYGAGPAGFVLVPVSRGIAGRVLDGAAAAGGVAIGVPRGRAVRIGTPLLSLAVRSGRGGSVLLVGTVEPEVLERAVVELSGARA